MNPTLDWLNEAEERIRHTLDELRPKLLETQGKVEHELKDDKTAVTEMDTLVEDKLREALFEYDSSIAFSGEESGVDFDQKTFWMVDPIDGTEPFIRGLPFATNMVALIDNGQPILSIINNFGLGEYYMAIKGQGATKNGHPIQVSKAGMDRALISFGRIKPDAKEGFGAMDKLREKFGKGVNSFNVAASGYTFSVIADGGIEGRVNYKGSHSNPWDNAPGVLLIQEAGGRVANIGSDKYDFRNSDFIAANPVIFDQLMEFMVDLSKQAG